MEVSSPVGRPGLQGSSFSSAVADRDDLRRPPRGPTEPRPANHHLPPLLEQISTPIRGLDLIADRVRQRHLGDLTREVRSLRRLIAEARPEAVVREVASVHPLENGQHRHVRSGLPFLPPGSTKPLSPILFMSSRITIAAEESGTRCSRPAFIRAAGTTQIFSPKSISSHRPPITSPVRVAVRSGTPAPARRSLVGCAASRRNR